jgi:eukaryotic-like serine/threonine-protein kinase
MVHDLQPGDPQSIGPYRLRGVLGAGGMARVFLGASAEGQLVAVKVVQASLAADPVFRARFRREVEVARKVSGPFTAPVIDAGLDGPAPWLATAYVAGSSLEDAVLEGGPMAPGAVLEVAARLAAALAAIHDAGVVHRDLKPSNILLAEDGPRLIDFGVSTASGAATLTTTGLTIGSPGFMSPEQAEGLPAGPASDIFSLGAVLAFAATGEGPFGAGSSAALLYRVVHRPADLDHVPREIRGLIERCLIKDPALRPTARDLKAATGAGRPVPSAVTGAGRPVPPAATEADQTVPLALLVPPDLPPDLPLSLGVWEQVPRAQDRPRRRERRPSRPRNWRTLSAAAAIAALLGAAAGLVLTASPDPAPAAQSARSARSAQSAQSQRPVAAARTPAPATSAPPSSAAARLSAEPRTSPSVAGQTSSPAPPPVSTAPAAGGTGPASSAPFADATSPADATSSMGVNSPPPSASPSPTDRSYPPASPTPSASPTPTSGGYGY